jgi:hypothetical protein
MKKLIILAVLVGGGYYAFQWFKENHPVSAPASDGSRSSGANATQRIDNLSGAAPSDR